MLTVKGLTTIFVSLLFICALLLLFEQEKNSTDNAAVRIEDIFIFVLKMMGSKTGYFEIKTFK